MGRPLMVKDVVPYLSRVLTSLTRHPHDKQLKIGLCVSGGPDSMALTHLVQQVARQKVPGQLEVQAFIIDHKARDGSTQEAKTVGKWLDDLGVVKSTILEMEWKSRDLRDTSIDKLTNFETQARRERYRMLANAAVKADVKFLLLGHHQDDQVENILMRLNRDLTGSLRSCTGMQIEAPLPYCEHIPGAHEEGVTDLRLAGRIDRVLTRARYSRNTFSTFFDLLGRSATVNGTAKVAVASGPVKLCASGGVRLIRPLLSFPKALLEETCRANFIPYIEDQTNLDPTYTTRNAIRHIRKQHNLPRALSTESILELQRCAFRGHQQILERGAELARRARLISLDLRTCVAMYHMPRDLLETLVDCDPGVAGNAIARLLDTVGPKISYTDGTSLTKDSILSVVNPSIEASIGAMRSAHTGRSVHGGYVTSRTRRNVLVSIFVDPVNRVFWRLSREPLSEAPRFATTQQFELEEAATPGDRAGSKWLFWDFRYWIRLYTPKAEDISKFSIRACQEADINYLTKSLRGRRESQQEWEQLKEFLHATGDVKLLRYTVPIVTFCDQPCALPTFGFRFSASHPEHVFSVVYKEFWRDNYAHEFGSPPSKVEGLPENTSTSRTMTFQPMVVSHAESLIA